MLEDWRFIFNTSSDTMTKRNGQLHRENLLTLRARLLGDVNNMTNAALGDAAPVRMPSEMADVGTDAFEQELTLGLLGNEEEVLQQIDAALVRIEEGSYGKCEECGRAIAKARLDAIPYAALCVRCASLQENGHANGKPR
jgi:DnaK suppressor protein